MRLQRAHAHLFGQGEGLVVVGFGLGNVRRITMRGSVAQETVRMRLVTMPCVGAGEIEEAFGKSTRLVHAVNEEQGLAQLGEHNSVLEYTAPGGKALQHLVQEWKRLRNTPGKGIRCPQDGGGQGKETRDVAALAERQAPFERRDRLLEHSLTAVETTNRPKRTGYTIGLLDCLAQPHRVFCQADALGEVPQFGQTPGYKGTGAQSGRGDPAQARIAEFAGEQCHHLSRHIQRLPKVPHGMVGLAQIGLSVQLGRELLFQHEVIVIVTTKRPPQKDNKLARERHDRILQRMLFFFRCNAPAVWHHLVTDDRPVRWHQ